MLYALKQITYTTNYIHINHFKIPNLFRHHTILLGILLLHMAVDFHIGSFLEFWNLGFLLHIGLWNFGPFEKFNLINLLYFLIKKSSIYSNFNKQFYKFKFKNKFSFLF